MILPLPMYFNFNFIKHIHFIPQFWNIILVYFVCILIFWNAKRLQDTILHTVNLNCLFGMGNCTPAVKYMNQQQSTTTQPIRWKHVRIIACDLEAVIVHRCHSRVKSVVRSLKIDFFLQSHVGRSSTRNFKINAFSIYKTKVECSCSCNAFMKYKN